MAPGYPLPRTGMMILICLTVSLLLGVPCPRAADTHWIGPTTNNYWNNPANWSNGVPQTGYHAYLITSNENKSAVYNHSQNPLLDTVTIDGLEGFTFTLYQKHFTLSAMYEYIGVEGKGLYHQSGGTNRVTKGLYLGYGPGSSGAYAKGAGTLLAEQAWIGFEGMGSFTQSGGLTEIKKDLVLGSKAGGSGTVTMKSGTFTVGGNETIGSRGKGTFTQNGGTHTIGGFLTLGSLSGSDGTFTLKSGTLRVGLHEVIGSAGEGSFLQESGTHQISGNLTLGAAFNATGFFTLKSGTLQVKGDETVGLGGRGFFAQDRGTHSVGGRLFLGAHDQALGSYRLQSGTLSVGKPLEGGDDILISSRSSFSVNGTATVSGDVENRGQVYADKAEVTWNGNFRIAGHSSEKAFYKSSESKQTFTGNLFINNYGYIKATSSQDVFFIKNDFINQSLLNSLWNTESAALQFISGSDNIHDFYIAGVDHGTTPVTENFNWALLDITGQIINLKDGNAIPHGAQYVRVLKGADLDVANLIVKNIFGDNTSVLNIYYDKYAPENAYLGGLDYAFAGGLGKLIADDFPPTGSPVPLPGSVLLFGTGLAGVAAWIRGRRRRSAGKGPSR